MEPETEPLLELKQRVSAAMGGGDWAGAAALCDKAEGTVPVAELAFIRGVLAVERGDAATACALLGQASEALPDRSDVAYNYGVALQKAGDLAGAVAQWARTVALDPHNAAAWGNRALGTSLLGDLERARVIYRQALALHGNDRSLLYNYANLLYRLGEWAEGEETYKKLLTFDPGYAQAWVNRGLTLKALGRYDEAELCYKQAIAHADAAPRVLALFNLSHLFLLQERWREGWAAYEARHHLPGAPVAPWGLPPWRSSLAEGARVLLWSDQGLGDAIMFFRFASAFAAKGYKLSAFVPSALRTLAGTMAGIDGVFTPDDPPQAMEAALPLCSLPYVLNVDGESLPSAPYIETPARGEPLLVPRAPGIKRVGLVWAGNPAHSNDAQRSFPLATLAPLFDVPGIEWFSLQLGGGSTEVRDSPWHDTIRDLSPGLADFAATAAFLKELDLLITVDTAPAHLAGAMGAPVWLLLPAIGLDWRWRASGDTSRWYPSARLFRQDKPGDWTGAVGRVAQALRTL